MKGEYIKMVKHMDRPSKKKIFITVLSIIVVSIIMAIFVLIVVTDILGIGKDYHEISVDIPMNASTEEISNVLEENNIIERPLLFRLFSKLTKSDGQYKYGLYALNSNMPYSDIINTLKKASDQKNNIVKVTFKEGETLNEYAANLEKNGVCLAKDFLNEMNNVKLNFWFVNELKDNPLKYQKLEGFAFPNTYEFYLSENPSSVVEKLLKEFNKKFTTDMKNRMSELNMSIQDIITLASIIQAESGNIDEMKKVSSVFHNRIKNSTEYPKLQSDPTKNYVRDDIKPNLDPPNESIYQAYDTYESAGLPPGAICNPGLDAILATLYPDTTPYYYFASNLQTGEFFYAETLGQHEANLVKAGLT